MKQKQNFVRKAIFLAATGLFLTGGSQSALAEADKYRLVWNHDPATTMTIGWSQSNTNTHYLRYGETDVPSTWVRADVGTITDYTNDVRGSSNILTSYFVDLEELTPDAAYYFQVCEEGGACGDSSWFKTAPDTAQPFTFIAGGDSRTNEVPRREGNILVSKLRPLFIAHGGDYLDDGTYDEWVQWLDEWQLTRSSDGRMYPVIPAHGNHENDVINMVSLIFNTPNIYAYSAFSIGGNLFRLYTLNTEIEPGVGYSAFSGQDDSAWNEQNNWLATDLSINAPTSTWLAANYHRPLRPHQSGKAEGIGRYSEWTPLFDQHQFDLAIECDSHLAKYTYPVRPSSGSGSFEGFIRDDANGTAYIGEGSWGAPHRANNDDKPWTLASDSFWQINLIQVDTSNIHVRKVKFGSFSEPYNSSGVPELTQAQQDANAFAIPTGLDLWKPLAGEVLTLPFTGAEVENIRLVSTNASWSYLDNGQDLVTDWQTPAFDDSDWQVGNGQLGYGDGDETTVISFGSDENDKYITSYFRKHFTVTDPDSVIRLTLRLLRDDGAVVYINGVEASRSNMPEGAISASTLAHAAIGGSAEKKYNEIGIDPDLLVAGNNVIAVEIHQAGSTSSDVSFDLDLTAVQSMVSGSTPAAPSNLVATPLGANDIELDWDDNATDETKYELQRKVGEGTWQILETQLAVDSNHYTNNLLAEGQEYSYRVRAYNASGRSAYSNEVTITTLFNPVPAIAGYSWDFEENTFGSLSTVNISSDHNWRVSEHQGQHFARMNGYGADVASDDWLITPALPLSYFTDASISFDSSYNYNGPELEIHVSTNYDPDNGIGTWTQLQSGVDFQLPQTGSYTSVGSGDIDLAPYSSEHTYFGIRYVSTGTGGGDGRIWIIDNIILRGTPVRLLDIETFDDALGSWSSYSRSSTADWHNETRKDQQGAFNSGYGADTASYDWLISPAFSIADGDSAMLHFDYYGRYGGPMLEVYVSTDYSGVGDPLADNVTWQPLAVPLNAAINDTWENIAGYDISSFSGSSIHVAFHYLSTGTGPGDGRRWGVDNIGVSLMPPQPLAIGINVTPHEEFFTTAETISFLSNISGGDAPYSYLWDFGNGDSSSDAEPVYMYPTAGDYTITLTVEDSSGEYKERTFDVSIVEATENPVPEKLGDLRVATFNILMAWGEHAQGRLIENLATPDWNHAQKVAEIIQLVNPDVILLNEFDYDAEGAALANFQSNYLGVSQGGAATVNYPYTFIAPSNTGIPSGVDFNGDGDTTDPEDAFGYGWYPGAYGMVVLSKYPIAKESVRTFQQFLWKDMPNNLLPLTYYSEEAQNVFRLSSKSHWDVPVEVNGRLVHILGSHPTPPVFDGPEDRNGRRNHDEIRFWADYASSAGGSYIYDDKGISGGLSTGSSFVIMGDQNADPDEGDSTGNAILQLLEHANINTMIIPESEGSLAATGDADDTASWGLRADYVLPSVDGLVPQQGQVFWPSRTDVNYHLVRNDVSSDHRLVWLDLSVEPQGLQGDLDNDGDVDRNDLRIIRNHIGQSAADFPAYDLDNDGRITIRDARKAVTMCTRPRCATDQDVQPR